MPASILRRRKVLPKHIIIPKGVNPEMRKRILKNLVEKRKLPIAHKARAFRKIG